MSHQLISLSPDLKRLRDEGYDIEVRSSYLLVKNVPYVDSAKNVKTGALVSELVINGDVAGKPNTHVAYFRGEYPCNTDGSQIGKIKNASETKVLDKEKDIVIDHTFSACPKPSGSYSDYHHKVTTYVGIITGPAQAIDPSATAMIFPVIETEESDSVFRYFDTASSRAQIVSITRKLEIAKVAIVGVGGTGSYILDLVAKTPVKEIHILDGDIFSNHNAFRSPGAPSIEELRGAPKKAKYFKDLYSKIHRHITAHECYLDASNMELLRDMSFVFVAMDNSEAKGLIIGKLEEWAVPFIDVGMGVQAVDDSLLGIVRTTTSANGHRRHVRSRISLADGGKINEYSQNIQIADLNALNAALAVIKWKKMFGFYRDIEKECFSAYTIDGNTIINEDNEETSKSS